MERAGNASLAQRSFQNEASSSAVISDNDVDFDDVFGGPPTRTRYSFGGGRIKSEESTSSSTGLGERPVFGDSYSSPRRRTSDDFYDDIFRRSDESVRSPRWSSPTPGSRTLSPAHPKIEPFATSLPTEFSLPARVNKAIGTPIFGSSSSSPHRNKDGASSMHIPNTILSRFSSPAMQGRDVFRSNSGQSPGQTLLSRESSGFKESPSTESEIGHKSKHATATTPTGSPSSEFHFSIHKWANIGVPLLISLRGGTHPTLKGTSKVSALSGTTLDAGFSFDDLSADKEDIKNVSGSGLMEVTEKEILIEKQQVKEQEIILPRAPLHNEIKRQGDQEAGKEVEGKENTETVSDDVGATVKKNLEVKKMKSSKKAEAIKPAVGSPKSSSESSGRNRVKGMVKDFFKMSNQESPPKTKSNVVGRSLSSRWKTTARNRSYEELADSMPISFARISAADVQMMPEASNPTEMSSKVSAEDVKTATDASSKIPLADKVFVENVKTATDASSKIPLYGKVFAENVKTATDTSRTIPLDSKGPTDDVNMMPDAPFMAQGHIGKPDKPKFARNRTIKKLEDIYFHNDASPASESVPYGSKVSVDNIDDPSLDNFQVEELSLVSETQEESEAIRALDSKIHLWSNGRKGNIRSLLSTLQLVLWAESGWKPVALVDIIESNAVKKAYNRAMLCLHPDKLQQKGADSHKRYMAEKVFDILQEAWDHFNSLGTLL